MITVGGTGFIAYRLGDNTHRIDRLSPSPASSPGFADLYLSCMRVGEGLDVLLDVVDNAWDAASKEFANGDLSDADADAARELRRTLVNSRIDIQAYAIPPALAQRKSLMLTGVNSLIQAADVIIDAALGDAPVTRAYGIIDEGLEHLHRATREESGRSNDCT